MTIRKYVDQDGEVEAVWAPITHYLEPDPYTKFPSPLHNQLVLNREARELIRRWHDLDVIVVHAFQLFAYLSVYRQLRGGPVLALYQDYAPFRDTTMLRLYGQDVPYEWQQLMRFRLQAHFSRDADLCFPWTEWAARSFIDDCRLDERKVHVIAPGVDLSLWPYVDPPRPEQGRPVRLLFVGGDFERKGGKLLLEVFSRLSQVAELDIVTRQAPEVSSDRIRIHTGLRPTDPKLRRLFGECDIFVLPTYAEMAGLVFAEAMATGRPVVATRVGGVPDMVRNGMDGLLVAPGDAAALRRALAHLIDDASLRHRIGVEARAQAEKVFDARANAGRMLSILKQTTDSRKGAAPMLASPLDP